MVDRKPIEEPKRRVYAHIVEFPSKSDLMERHFEGERLYNLLQWNEISCNFYVVTDLTAFDHAIYNELSNVISSFQKKGEMAIPVLHLNGECQPQGILMSDDTFLKWDTLADIVAPVNKWIKEKILLGLSTWVDGDMIVKEMTKQGEMPFAALVTPDEAITIGESVMAFSIFYHHFSLDQHGIERIVQIMGDASGKKFRVIVP